MLEWHVARCHWCTGGMKLPPPIFGNPDVRHCQEFYDIIKEYSEYEALYAWRGNP